MIAVALGIVSAATVRRMLQRKYRQPPRPAPQPPHLPPGAVLRVPDGVPPGWPWVDDMPEGWTVCRRSCGMQFPSNAAAWEHSESTDPAIRAACEALHQERLRAYKRAGRLRMMADPERSTHHRQQVSQYRRNRYATDPEYRERINARDRRRRQRQIVGSQTISEGR